MMIMFLLGVFAGFVLAYIVCAAENEKINMDYYNKGREDAMKEFYWKNKSI